LVATSSITPTVVPMPSDKSQDKSKGKNKRCADQPWVGGVPTRPGEVVWVLRGGTPVRLKSRHQLTRFPERTVVAPAGTIPSSEWFAVTAELPASAWVGYTSRELARGATAKRRGGALYDATIAAAPNLESRIATSGGVRTRPSLDLAPEDPAWVAAQLLAREFAAHGGRTVAVGGAVREYVSGQLFHKSVQAKDIDLEVSGLDPSVVHQIVAAHYPVDLTGQSFAVLKAFVPGAAYPLDISIPRRERAIGEGHRDFEVSADPSLSFVEAASRRDFTIGAMGFDILTSELLDPYGGAADLAAGVLRHVSDAFDEDPLRALRAARFAARFGLTVHPDTVARCRALRPQADALPAERRWGEIVATLEQAATPGRALHVLNEIEWIDLFLELAATRGVAQDPTWHPEGDVFTHTAAVLDYWGTNLRTGVLDDDLLVAVAAMCHDFGKVEATQHESGRITSHGHESAGVAPARAFLNTLGQVHLASAVAPYIENHLAPVALIRANASDRALRRLATKVPRLDLLAIVARADQGGRPGRDPSEALAECSTFEQRVASLGVARGPLPNLARGEHLIEMGQTPGPHFKELLGAAYEAQLDGEITTSEQARAFLAESLSKRPPSPSRPS
jgi:tRNA nucleotidyltransferase (CCA-adding enzyme)